ncbi:hypothetical protein ACFE04_025308 [Oxalis oulophora]
MEEYGNAESWRNIWQSAKDYDLSLFALPLPAHGMVPDVLGLLKNGQILLKVFVYDEDKDVHCHCIMSADSAGENRKVKVFGKDDLDHRCIPSYFVESLVLLDKANTYSE